MQILIVSLYMSGGWWSLNRKKYHCFRSPFLDALQRGYINLHSQWQCRLSHRGHALEAGGRRPAPGLQPGPPEEERVWACLSLTYSEKTNRVTIQTKSQQSAETKSSVKNKGFHILIYGSLQRIVNSIQ